MLKNLQNIVNGKKISWDKKSQLTLKENIMLKNLYLICGESGCGKSTVAEELNKNYGYEILRSYTTRPKRHEEDIDHTYITEEEYQQLPNKVATTLFNDYHYCCTKEQLETADLYVIDKDGINTLRANYAGERKLVVIRLKAAGFIRAERMMKRGDGAVKALERIRHDKVAFQGIEKITDYTVEARYDLIQVVHSVHRIIQIEEGVIDDKEIETV